MNILYYGGHYWDRGAWFRKQQFASRLAKRGHTIFYIEDSVSMIRKTDNHKNKYIITSFNKINNNLYIITPSCLFPLPNNYWSRFFFNLKLLLEIKIFFYKQDIQDFIIWYSHVPFSNILFLLKKRKIIFDLCDDLPYYSKLFNDEKGYETSMRHLRNAFYFADVAIVSALRIKEKYQYLAKDEIIVIPNGHNLTIPSGDILSKTRILLNIKKPIIGFIGTLFKFIDDDILEYIIKERPNYSYVFIGKVQSDFPIEKIRVFENVFLLGEKKKEEVQSFIAEFDICINPFRKHEVNDSVSPVKVFEYLALHKPVVSTNMYSLQREEIADYISFTNDKKEFIEKLDSIVNRHSIPKTIPARILQNYSWDNLFEKLINLINTQINI